MVDGKRVADLAAKAQVKIKEVTSKRQTAGPMAMHRLHEGD
ncbi:hypothetical protein SAMN05444161_4655 [Rhizobiales bacterium GAS191]|nr:hypothetical protein SAMN05444161_4655 [Rhizobiales bacterium GAS191]